VTKIIQEGRDGGAPLKTANGNQGFEDYVLELRGLEKIGGRSPSEVLIIQRRLPDDTPEGRGKKHDNLSKGKGFTGKAPRWWYPGKEKCWEEHPHRKRRLRLSVSSYSDGKTRKKRCGKKGILRIKKKGGEEESAG